MPRKPGRKRREAVVGLGQADASPNPHGGTNIIEMPIQTDQRQHTHGASAGRPMSTPEGNLNTSVTVNESFSTGSGSGRSSKTGYGAKVHTMKKKGSRKTA